ncbi:pantoate--beta-alanine ligase [Effusibacillus lacus]|uniref:Pantothenate synthetase n=1 Tax=Effusibacillus lacus TaxID=1348429 RepID=A0A292YMN9_9BACL|nr:pantoate--beta-alanine ligase [Effusibacillus lacus]TCS75331.1 pantothenate synthetase [Effusibacillus lacus]GAX89765.1 pantoate--beta-alanine ligase [Effusibacillus lacus]
MRMIHTIDDMRHLVGECRQQGKTIGFVPTMGYLHEGHMSLVRRAKAECDFVVMSIFVNPLQFGPAEDYEQYPRNLDRDANLAKNAGVDAIFVPSVNEMYPQKQLVFVEVEEITNNLCGVSRPGHFRGVATVVAKLLNIVQPDKAFFGQKDAQQVRVIQQMVQDLNMPVEIVPCPIVRESDGLAMSSRNVYLSSEERLQALSIQRALLHAEELFKTGERSATVIEQQIRSIIEAEPLAEVDYIKIVDLQNLTDVSTIEDDSLLAVAVRFGGTRLIDNTILYVKEGQPCFAQ